MNIFLLCRNWLFTFNKAFSFCHLAYITMQILRILEMGGISNSAGPSHPSHQLAVLFIFTTTYGCYSWIIFTSPELQGAVSQSEALYPSFLPSNAFAPSIQSWDLKIEFYFTCWPSVLYTHWSNSGKIQNY